PFQQRFQEDLENQVQTDLLEVQVNCTSFQVVMLEDVNGLSLLMQILYDYELFQNPVKIQLAAELFCRASSSKM
ncbi:uncharacterized protein METZ01_LOCUS445210, partial [marine metagenome]